MNVTDLFNERLFHSRKKIGGNTRIEDMSSKQMSRAKFEEKYLGENRSGHESRSAGNWCEAVSSSLSNVNAKQAWKNGTEKLSQTLNNVRTTFGVLSQRIKKSTRKRQPLINMDSPVTPYTRSRVALGRTPTKLYSPFSIDTPIGKENVSDRFIQDEVISDNAKGRKKKLKRTRLNLNIDETDKNIGEAILSNDLLHTQIGIYEFQSVANRIVQNNSKN